MNSRKILIVDDEQDVLVYLSTLLRDNGFEVVEAHNGKEAFELAKSEKPDLITLDITMPEESGVRAYRDLCDDSETSKIPIIIITGITTEFKRFIGSRKQVPPPMAYFEKPVERESLLSKIKEILG